MTEYLITIPDGDALEFGVLDDVDDDTGRPYNRTIDGFATIRVTLVDDFYVGTAVALAVPFDHVPDEWVTATGSRFVETGRGLTITTDVT